MKIDVNEDKVTLELNGKTIQGSIDGNTDYYFNCLYVFDISPDLTWEDLQNTTALEFSDNTCVLFYPNVKPDNYLSFFYIGRKNYTIHYRVSFELVWERWTEDINISKVFTQFKQSDFDKKYTTDIGELDTGFFFQLIFQTTTNESFTEQINSAVEYFGRAFKQIIASISNPDTFISQFKFPNEYKHIFTQYLTYFGKFLEDLGIAGEVSIEQKDGKTILKVASDQKQENLDQINAALLSYISLPSADISTIVKPTPDLESQIRLQQLMSAVDHMKSQLNLSKAMISVKDREIELLHATNNQLRTSFIPRAELSSDLTDYWEPLEGVKIKALRGSFYEIDIPLWVKKIKNRLQKK